MSECKKTYSVSQSLYMTTKYKALTTVVWIVSLPLMLPLVILDRVGEHAERIGRKFNNIAYALTIKLCLLFRWQGINIYEWEDDEYDL